MINTSSEYKKMIRQNRNFNVKLTVIQADSTTIEIPKSKLRSFAYDSATSSSNSFDIGGAITGELDFTLDNINSEFSEEQFYEARVWAYVGLELSATTEWLLIGVYDVIDASTTGNVISVQAFDAMNKFCKDYSESTLAYPATLFQIVQDACTHCGVVLGSSSFDYGTNIVQTRPDDGSITFKDMLSYVGQKSGHYAIVRNDALYLDWYDMSSLNTLDGGNSDFTGTDIIDGNGTTDIIDGNVTSDYFHIYAISGSPNIAIQDITITGIKVTAKGDSTTEGESYLYGEEGYVLEIADNPLILPGEAQAVATHLGQKIVGLTFRPFSVDAKSDPSIQAGDVGFVTNRKQQSYASIVTNIAFAYGDYETFGCGAKSKEKKAAKNYSETTKALQEAKKDAARQISAYDIQMQYLTNLMTMGFGVYKFEEKQEDGSYIYYLCDKPALEESQKIWKMTADAFAVSSDGGETWNAGVDASGNIVANVLSVIGVNAEWIKAGTIEGSIIAKNLIMQGGSINIDTTDSTQNKIVLNFPLHGISTKLSSTTYELSNNEYMFQIYMGGFGPTLGFFNKDRTIPLAFLDKEGLYLSDDYGNLTSVYGKIDCRVAGDLYVGGDVTADYYYDFTPHYDGDALSELAKISDDGNGNIDHDTLPEFAHKKIKKRIEKKPDSKAKGKKAKSTSDAEKEYEEIEEDGRDIGAMISIHTKAFQQLIEKNEEKDKIIDELLKRIESLESKVIKWQPNIK